MAARCSSRPNHQFRLKKKLGADIIIPFDELPPYHIDPQVLKKSLYRTHRWEERSLQEHVKNKQQQAMYAVIHGGIDKNLRTLSCKTLTALPFDGFAVGGSLGKNRQEMVEMLTSTMPLLPEDKPNHLLGIGDLASIDECVALGVDTFDSSHPTRCARHGLLFTSRGPIKILQTKYQNVFDPIDPACSCPVCATYSLAYIHHMFKANELTGFTLASIHNLAYMVKLMADYRQKIMNGEL